MDKEKISNPVLEKENEEIVTILKIYNRLLAKILSLINCKFYAFNHFRNFETYSYKTYFSSN